MGYLKIKKKEKDLFLTCAQKLADSGRKYILAEYSQDLKGLHMMSNIERMDGISFVINVMRNLAYYNGVTFDAFADDVVKCIETAKKDFKKEGIKKIAAKYDLQKMLKYVEERSVAS